MSEGARGRWYRPGTVMHFSEDPGLTRFAPHVAATAQESTPYVWAVDDSQSPAYWFPRDCPRAMAWSTPTTTEDDRRVVLGPGARRVHMIEYVWLDRLRGVELYVYRFDAADFVPHGTPDPFAQVADHPVVPLGPAERVPDLLALHAEAGVELRVVVDLWPWWSLASRSTCGFSGIRLARAAAPVAADQEGSVP